MTNQPENQNVIDALIHAYEMELETVQNYIANATNLVGLRAEEIKKSLETDITEELNHAQRIAKRIHVIGGTVPGSLSLKRSQKSLQPPSNPADIVTVIQGVIEQNNKPSITTSTPLNSPHKQTTPSQKTSSSNCSATKKNTAGNSSHSSPSSITNNTTTTPLTQNTNPTTYHQLPRGPRIGLSPSSSKA